MFIITLEHKGAQCFHTRLLRVVPWALRKPQVGQKKKSSYFIYIKAELKLYIDDYTLNVNLIMKHFGFIMLETSAAASKASHSLGIKYKFMDFSDFANRKRCLRK